jgi:hypothetical protein
MHSWGNIRHSSCDFRRFKDINETTMKSSRNYPHSAWRESQDSAPPTFVMLYGPTPFFDGNLKFWLLEEEGRFYEPLQG